MVRKYWTLLHFSRLQGHEKYGVLGIQALSLAETPKDAGVGWADFFARDVLQIFLGKEYEDYQGKLVPAPKANQNNPNTLTWAEIAKQGESRAVEEYTSRLWNVFKYEKVTYDTDKIIEAVLKWADGILQILKEGSLKKEYQKRYTTSKRALKRQALKLQASLGGTKKNNKMTTHSIGKAQSLMALQKAFESSGVRDAPQLCLGASASEYAKSVSRKVDAHFTIARRCMKELAQPR